MKRPVAMVFAEGRLDCAAAVRVVEAVGLRVEGGVVSAGGVDQFWGRIGKFNEAARRVGVVFALADHDGPGCAGEKVRKRVPGRHADLVLRLSVFELEAWLMADAVALGAFLRVPEGKFPREPDGVVDAKGCLVALARGSAKPEVRRGMVPKEGYSAVPGAQYSAMMEEFIVRRWRSGARACGAR
jgi:hypothetical protein